MTGMNFEINDMELLKFVQESDKINLSEARIEYAMKKYDELLLKHPYEIWQGNNGKWYTYLPDKKKGRVLKKLSTEKKD